MIPTNDTVTVEKTGALDDWGRPTGVTVETFKCRIDYEIDNKTITSLGLKMNQSVVPKAIILIKGVALITLNDLLKWSDSYGNQQAKPLSIIPIKDLSGKVIFTKVVV